ncbi:hypothetical protein [Isoptericola sp. NPDC057559]|uniref:hypothetical protein n=1 Tax=Isoptericola sp. NPDC057559 TaxID=3346168 RepID=UPI0036C7A77D
MDGDVQRIDLGDVSKFRAWVHAPTGLAVLHRHTGSVSLLEWREAAEHMNSEGYAAQGDVAPEDVPSGGVAYWFVSVARLAEELTLTDDEFLAMSPSQYVEAERSLNEALLAEE